MEVGRGSFDSSGTSTLNGGIGNSAANDVCLDGGLVE